MLPTSRHEYGPVSTSDRRNSHNAVNLGSLFSSDEACNTTPNETGNEKAITSPRAPTTGWKTTVLLFGFYIVGKLIMSALTLSQLLTRIDSFGNCSPAFCHDALSRRQTRRR
jgi:hypothetical protein